jgi:phenylacetate-CoA ligase
MNIAKTVKEKSTTSPFWNEAIETMPPDKLWRDVEQPRLVSQMEHVRRSSPFYQNKLKGFALSVIDKESFSTLPFTEKSELIADQEAHPPFGDNLSVSQKDLQRIHRTSGSTGRPLFLALTGEDIESITECGARCFWAAGLRPEDSVFHCLNYCLWIGGYTDHQSLETTGAAVIPYGTGNSVGLLESILYLKPTAIHCTPSYLSKLEALLLSEFNKKPLELGLKKGFFGGEGGIENPELRSKIEKTWGIQAYNANYGVSDALSMIGSECSQRDGLHYMAQGHLYTELIDPVTLKRIPMTKGARGELVFTNLMKRSQPLVRFRSHDVVEIVSDSACECGRTSFRFHVIGRSDDLIVVKGVNFFPSSVGNLLHPFLDSLNGEFQILVKNEPPIETVKIRLEYKRAVQPAQLAVLKDAIQHKMKSSFYVNPDLEFIPEGSLVKSEDGKIKRVLREKASV